MLAVIMLTILIMLVSPVSLSLATTASTHLLCPKFTVSECEQTITLIGDKCYEGGFGQIHPCFDICNNLPSDPEDESVLDMCNALCPDYRSVYCSFPSQSTTPSSDNPLPDILPADSGVSPYAIAIGVICVIVVAIPIILALVLCFCRKRCCKCSSSYSFDNSSPICTFCRFRHHITCGILRKKPHVVPTCQAELETPQVQPVRPETRPESVQNASDVPTSPNTRRGDCGL